MAGKKLQALVFDFDGTILDTETLWFELCAQQWKEHGETLRIEDYARCVGASLQVWDPYLELAKAIGGCMCDPKRLESMADELKSELIRRFEEVFPQISPRPGIVALLESANKHGLPCAVASSSARISVLPHLATHGLSGFFSAVLCSDDVGGKTKPAPDLYLAACSALGVEPSTAVAFEDSPNGCTSAKAAGLSCVLVPNPLTSRFAVGPHDLSLESHEAITLEQLEKLVLA